MPASIFDFDWRECLVYLGRGWCIAATISVEEAQSNFPGLLARVIAGEEVVISNQERPVAPLATAGKDLPANEVAARPACAAGAQPEGHCPSTGNFAPPAGFKSSCLAPRPCSSLGHPPPPSRD